MSGKGTEEDIEAAEVEEGEERREVKRAALEEEGEDEEEGKINNEGREVEGHQTEGNREGTEGGSHQGDHQRQGRVVSDPISESYRSIVEVINRTSDGFREGKKWKCVAGTPIRPEQRQPQQQHFQYARPREQRKSHRRRSKGSSKAMTRSHTTEEGSRGGGGAKRLVRQTACAEEVQSASAGNVSSAESQQLLSAPPGVTAAHLRGRVSLPVRQWTVDASCPPALGQAYLLRPVSRGSIKSSTSGGGGGGDGGKRLSPNGDPLSLSASAGRRSPRPERLRAASFNVETNDGGAAVSVRSSSRSGSGRTALSAARVRVKKQRTCDSAPMRGGGGRAQQGQGPAAAFGGSNRHLPRQFSNASAYSAAAASLIPTSLSQQGMTLVRGASCSLVDIPTYLGPSYGGVELAQICDVRVAGGSTAAAAAALSTPSAPAAAALEESSGGAAVDLSQQRKSARPRLQVICWGGDE